jgi:hypothetical protein
MTQTTAELAHRIDMLEQIKESINERTKNTDKRVELLEQAAIDSSERLDAMNEVHTETMNTLFKMQITLEQLNEVLTTFNKWKNTGSIVRTIGDGFIWIAKVGIVITMLWSALTFHPGNTHTENGKLVQDKAILEKIIEMEK